MLRVGWGLGKIIRNYRETNALTERSYGYSTQRDITGQDSGQVLPNKN
jgi:hypothetical protein